MDVQTAVAIKFKVKIVMAVCAAHAAACTCRQELTKWLQKGSSFRLKIQITILSSGNLAMEIKVERSPAPRQFTACGPASPNFASQALSGTQPRNFHFRGPGYFSKWEKEPRPREHRLPHRHYSSYNPPVLVWREVCFALCCYYCCRFQGSLCRLISLARGNF